MKAKIGFTIILGVIYAVIALQASFGITTVHFWSGILGCVGMVSVLPLGILSIWRAKLAGRLLIVAAALFMCSVLVEIRSKEEVGVLALAFPIVLSGLLLLKEPRSTS